MTFTFLWISDALHLIKNLLYNNNQTSLMKATVFCAVWPIWPFLYFSFKLSSLNYCTRILLLSEPFVLLCRFLTWRLLNTNGPGYQRPRGQLTVPMMVYYLVVWTINCRLVLLYNCSQVRFFKQIAHHSSFPESKMGFEWTCCCSIHFVFG